MNGSIEVNPDGLAALGQQLALLADRVSANGHELAVVGRPVLGGTGPSHDLAIGLSRNVSSSATWVMACGSALRTLAQAATEAAVAYRDTEVAATERFRVMAAAFDAFDATYGLLTDPA